MVSRRGTGCLHFALIPESDQTTPRYKVRRESKSDIDGSTECCVHIIGRFAIHEKYRLVEVELRWSGRERRLSNHESQSICRVFLYWGGVGCAFCHRVVGTKGRRGDQIELI